MSVTIKDVANEAGVSTATVSHVINKTRYVSEDVTTRVLNAIEKLGYYHNLLYASLRGKKTYTIGLVLPNIANEIFGQLAEKIQKMLFKFGYHLIICSTSYDTTLEREAFNTLLMKKADAIIAIPTSSDSGKLKEIKDMGIPIVLVDRVIDGFNVDTVRVDNFKGTYDMITYLISLGHRSIGYIDRKLDLSHSIEQKMGYMKALEDHGIPYNPSNVIQSGGYDYKSGTDSVKRLIELNPNITAVSTYYDVIALGAMRGIFDLGYRIPEDISLVGYDGMLFTAASFPRLSTVLYPVSMIAKETCNLVIKRLEQKDAPETKVVDIVIMPKLILRESTSVPRNFIGLDRCNA